MASLAAIALPSRPVSPAAATAPLVIIPSPARRRHPPVTPQPTPPALDLPPLQAATGLPPLPLRRVPRHPSLPIPVILTTCTSSRMLHSVEATRPVAAVVVYTRAAAFAPTSPRDLQNQVMLTRHTAKAVEAALTVVSVALTVMQVVSTPSTRLRAAAVDEAKVSALPAPLVAADLSALPARSIPLTDTMAQQRSMDHDAQRRASVWLWHPVWKACCLEVVVGRVTMRQLA